MNEILELANGQFVVWSEQWGWRHSKVSKGMERELLRSYRGHKGCHYGRLVDTGKGHICLEHITRPQSMMFYVHLLYFCFVGCSDSSSPDSMQEVEGGVHAKCILHYLQCFRQYFNSYSLLTSTRVHGKKWLVWQGGGR